jgi:hypothetical protein
MPVHDRGTAPPREGQRPAGPLSEPREIALAGELLEVADRSALAEVIARVVQAGAGSSSRFVASPVGRALRAQLQEAAPTVAPFVGHRIGAPVRAVAGRGARALGISLEGLSPEDAEFELARYFVRFAGAAARRASSGAQGSPSASRRTA